MNTSIACNYNNCYRNNKSAADLFIFEIILEKFDDEHKNLRKITRERSGSLIRLEDSILYDDVRKIELSAIDINKPNNEINVNHELNHTLRSYNIGSVVADSNRNGLSVKDTIIINNIYIEFKKIDNLLKCNFHFIHI
jgi:hypothetical protein